MIKNLFLSAVSALALAGAASGAQAGEALIQGVGFWGAATPDTPYSAPDESFQFSFDVPDPVGSDTTTDVTNFFYSLNGVTLATSASYVTFYTSSQHGMFDIVFPHDVVSIYGADIGSTGTIGPDGFYDSTAGINDVYPGTATGGVTVTVSPAPEASMWSLMIAGMAVMGGMLRYRRTKPAMA